MDVQLTLEPHDELVVRLRDGAIETSVSVPQSRPGAESLVRALESALATGHGECFWPCTTGGQYWWMFKRDADALEVIVMWTRGGASLWEHVFRATDSVDWVRGRIAHELDRLELAST
jgi:hypothetical protein